MIFEQEIKIALEDIDKNAYITNKAILRYFENTAIYHSDSVGNGIKSVEKTGHTWIVLDWRVKVINRPKYGEKLKVCTWSRGVQKFFAYRDYELFNEAGEKLAVGTSRWILRDITGSKMLLLNDEVMLPYEMENKRVLVDEEFTKMEVPLEFSNEMDYKVMRRDIDFNGHMHNLYHFDLAYDVLPDGIYENMVFDNFRITYKKEIKLGEKIKAKYAFFNDRHTVYVGNMDNNMNSIIQLW